MYICVYTCTYVWVDVWMYLDRAAGQYVILILQYHAGMACAKDEHKEHPQETAASEYDVEGDGLFVIVKQLTHKLHYHPSNKLDFNWGNWSPPNYSADEERLVKALNIDSTNSPGAAPTVIRQTDLSNDKFENFMINVCEQPKPAFCNFHTHGFRF